MAKLYSRINWVDYPSVTTPMNAINFNKMDKGIDDLDNSLNNLTTDVITLKNNTHMIGYNVLNNFEYGTRINSINLESPIVNNKKSIMLDVTTNNVEMYFKNIPKGYVVLRYSTFFNASNQKIVDSGGWQVVTENSIAFRTYDYLKASFPTIKYVSHTLAYSTNGSINSIVNIESLNDIYISEKNTVNARLESLEQEGKFNLTTVVDKDGKGDYTTISEAVENAINGELIIINSGVYDEHVVMYDKNIHLMGINKNTTFLVRSSKLYDDEPLQANMGTISNLTLIAGYGLTIDDNDVNARAYAIHIEKEYYTNYELTIDNCNIISYASPAIGMGLRYNQKVNIKNCYLESTRSHVWSAYNSEWREYGAFYCHNDAQNVGTNAYLNIENCEFKGVPTAMRLDSLNNGNTMVVRFIKNLLWSTTKGTSDAIIFTVPIAGHISGTDIILDNISYGNNIPMINA